MRIGVFGGTFDPIHIGHLILAEAVRFNADLDRILFVPANQPPHKLKQKLSPANQRMAMLNHAIIDYPELQVSDSEIRRGGVSYTIDTLDALQQTPEFQNQILFPIIGGDSLVELHTWKDPKQILEKHQVLCVLRPDIEIKHVDPFIFSKVQMIEAPLISISSSEIRDRVKQGKSIRFWVPDSVESYIHKQGLYL
ncbi:nicotinate-nucleotide adenylyltransferase [candidate division KSB1 bacterium]|nr:nicotinate-nucleotide adenylyltransferase [candidate division KSB1 bacterium]